MTCFSLHVYSVIGPGVVDHALVVRCIQLMILCLFLAFFQHMTKHSYCVSAYNLLVYVNLLHIHESSSVLMPNHLSNNLLIVYIAVIIIIIIIIIICLLSAKCLAW
jgi:hypothetical protein